MNQKDEKQFWEARRELRHLRDYARAWRAAPWAALGVTLARVVAATPHELQLPRRGSLNLFVALVGRSGGGKGVSTQASREAVRMADARWLPVGSGEGIAHQLAYYEKKSEDIAGGIVRTNWNLLIDIPEIDTMAAVGGRSGSTLLPELRKAWSGEQLGMGYAAKEKSLPIDPHSYRIALVAGVQPGRAGALLGDADGGTPQRFVWLPTDDPDAPDVVPDEPEAAEWVMPRQERRTSGPRTIPLCRKAKADIDEFRLANLRGQGTAMGAHEMLARLKMAAALGLFNGRTSVNDEDWELSELLAYKSRATREIAETHVAHAKVEEAREKGKLSHVASESFNEEERAIKRVCKSLLGRLHAAKSWEAHSVLRRNTAHRDRSYFDKAIERLMGDELISKEMEEGGVRYCLRGRERQ